MTAQIRLRREWWRGAVALMALWVLPATASPSDDPVAPEPRIRDITVIAERFHFTPAEIEVTQWDTVRLTLRAVDVPHGIAITELGVRVVARPDQDPVTVEFVADAPGRYRFTCAVFCGSGHGNMSGVLTVTSADGEVAAGGPDSVSDLEVDIVEPDFNLITLPTTLRLPHNSFAFRLTHRFSRPLAGGPGYGNLLEDFLGFDSPALIGLEFRYGLLPGTQIGIYRGNTKNIQIFGRQNILWQRGPSGKTSVESQPSEQA